MATTMTEIPIKDLALTTAPAGKQLLVRDASAGLQRIDYAQIAKNLVESYGSSSLAGKNQSIKAAIDSLNSGLMKCNTNITTINDSLSNIKTDISTRAKMINYNGKQPYIMAVGNIGSEHNSKILVLSETEQNVLLYGSSTSSNIYLSSICGISESCRDQGLSLGKRFDNNRVTLLFTSQFRGILISYEPFILKDA